MNPKPLELLATATFILAVLHTFIIGRFQSLGARYPKGSLPEIAFHYMGEVEVVFGLWAGIFILGYALLEGTAPAIEYLSTREFTEPLFVFAIMTVAATRPILRFARNTIFAVGSLSPMSSALSIFVTTLIAGPLLGSLITEPAAMTITALILREHFFRTAASDRFKYATLAALFVNISIGGVLTHFAAPPVLMVAEHWGWDTIFMLKTFGVRAALAICANASLTAFLLRKEITRVFSADETSNESPVPAWLTGVHLAFLALIVLSAHHAVVFIPLLLLFVGVAAITREYQSELRIQASLLVGLFLAGLIVLGGPQRWWLEPVIHGLSDAALFVGATALTAITDNAAITYLGSQVEGATASFKFALVAGAVAGGGLTVIANAPNPAGYSILQDRFGSGGIRPLGLLVAALTPTAIAMAALWIGH